MKLNTNMKLVLFFVTVLTVANVALGQDWKSKKVR
jgi:hypothetical protein